MLNSEDKKYLKDTVEKKLDNLDKKIDKGVNGAKGVSNPNTEIGKKLNELYKQNQEKDDREKLIEELQKKVNSGDATLAQKIELINQNLQKHLPPETIAALKDTNKTLKELSADVSNGASRSLRGVDSLISRLMYTNPLTGMLWSMSKGITRDFWNIGAGAAQAGWGIAKGIGQGVWNLGKGTAGIINSAVNMFHKKDTSDDETEDKDDKAVKQHDRGGFISTGKTVEEYEQAGLTTVDKIDEMHDWIFNKFPKQQEAKDKVDKEYQNIIAKGLNGLNGAMKTMHGFVEEILSKKKLILNGVMLGAIALLGLAAWFKSSKLRDIVTNAVKGTLPAIIDALKKNVVDAADQTAQSINLNGSGVENTQNKLDSLYGDVSSGTLNPKSEMDYANTLLSKDNSTSTKTQSYKRPENIGINKFYDSMHKSGVISKKGAGLLKSYGLGQDINKNVTVTTYNNTEGGSKLAFPVKIKVLDVELSGDKEHGMDIIIQKAESNSIKEFGKKVDNLGAQVRLLITNVKKLYVPTKTVVPANTTIALIGPYGRIIGPIEEFMKGESFDEYTNKNTKDSSTIDANFEKFASKKGMDKAYNESYDKLSKKFNIDAERAKLLNNPYKWWKDNGDTLKEEYFGSDDISKYEDPGFDKATSPSVPSNTLNGSNNTDNKVVAQKNTLQTQDAKERETQKVVSTPSEVKQPANNISINTGNNDGVVPSNFMRPDVANVAQDTYLSCMNGGG